MRLLNKRYEFSIFEIISVILLLAVIFWIVCCIFSIVILGFPALSKALCSKEIWFALRLSVFTATVSTSICAFIAIPSSYAMTHMNIPFKKLIQSIVELPLSLPYLLLGLCLLIIFSSDFGKILKSYGFKVVFDINGIIIAQCFVNLPFVIKLISNSFSEIDKRMLLVAGSLGAGKWKLFSTVIFPLSQNAIISALILAWSRALGEFGATLMLVGVTRMKTETLPASIYLNVSVGDNSMAMASAIMLLLLSLISSMGIHYFESKKPTKLRM